MAGAHDHVARGAREAGFARALERDLWIAPAPPVAQIQQIVAHFARNLVPLAIASFDDDVDDVLR